MKSKNQINNKIDQLIAWELTPPSHGIEDLDRARWRAQLAVLAWVLEDDE